MNEILKEIDLLCKYIPEVFSKDKNCYSVRLSPLDSFAFVDYVEFNKTHEALVLAGIEYYLQQNKLNFSYIKREEEPINNHLFFLFGNKKFYQSDANSKLGAYLNGFLQYVNELQSKNQKKQSEVFISNFTNIDFDFISNIESILDLASRFENQRIFIENFKLVFSEKFITSCRDRKDVSSITWSMGSYVINFENGSKIFYKYGKPPEG